MSTKERHDAFMKAGGDGKSNGVDLVNAVTQVMTVATAKNHATNSQTPQGEAKRRLLCIEQSFAALVQERDTLKADNRLLHSGQLDLVNRIAELEGDVARDAARYRFWRDCWGAERFLSTLAATIKTLAQPLTRGDYNNLDIVSDAAIAASKEEK